MASAVLSAAAGRFAAAVVQKPVINWASFVLHADGIGYFAKYWFGETRGSDADASVESAEQGENFEPLQPEQLRNATVKIRNLKKTFKNGVTAVDDLSVTFAPGEAVQI